MTPFERAERIITDMGLNMPTSDETRLLNAITEAIQAESNAQLERCREKFDLKRHIVGQIEFSREAFGPPERQHGVVAHIRKELAEIEAAPSDLEEWIDVMILAIDGAWRETWKVAPGPTPELMAAAICEKLAAKVAKNRARQWPDWRTVEAGKPIEHVKEPQYLAAAKRLAEARGTDAETLLAQMDVAMAKPVAIDAE